MREKPRETLSSELSIAVDDYQPPYPTAVLRIDSPEWMGYTFRFVLEADGIFRFEIGRDPATAAPLTTRRMQRIPLSALEQAFRARLTDMRDLFEQANPDRPFFYTGDWPDPAEKPRANRDDTRLAEIAAAYVEAPRLDDLADRFGYAPASMTKLISRARQRGLLTRTTRGRSGGSLTPRARELLRNRKDKQQ